MGFISSIFSKGKLSQPVSLSDLVNDVHSHFIPGIDDGAPDLPAAMELIRHMHAFGYKKVITTPHSMGDTYRNNAENILSGLELLRREIQAEKLDMVVDAAAEYYLDAEFEAKIENKELLTFGKNYVLFEMPFIGEPNNLAHIVFKMMLGGYQPVLAHAERYAFWHPDFQKIRDIREKGVLIQVNLASFTGHYGIPVKKCAEKLVDEKMIDLLGSDCHHTGHIELIQQACYLPYLQKAMETCPLRNRDL